MVSTYHGIETGRRALSYFRKGMEISGVNTTNVKTSGYSRQVVGAAATPGLEERPNVSLLGTGVEITSIQRMRDIYLDSRFVRAGVGQVYWATLASGADRVEKLIVDAGQKSLNDYLDGFWTAIQKVHKTPAEDLKAIRSNFLQSADQLAGFANSLAQNYGQYRDELNTDVKAMVKDANSYIDQIAILTEAIRKAMMAGAEPNELLDKRDLLAERLCILTGAEISRPVDELDGDYKINLNGKLLVQGTNTKHLILVENPANRNYYDVQVEYNQYDITSDAGVAGVIIETRAPAGGAGAANGAHELDVRRMADELYWTVGHGLGQSAGGERIDGIKDPNAALNINGSFALQVGSAGVRAISEAFVRTPPGKGIVLGPPGPGELEDYTFRISSGSFETTVNLKWNGASWDISDSFLPPNTASSAGPLTVSDLGAFLSSNYSPYGLDVNYQNDTITMETRDRQIMSINDIGGDLMRSSGLANKNPAVKIDIQPEDSFQTIVNKINNAYMFDRTYEVDADGKEKPKGNLKYETDPPGVSPARPEEWLHASVRYDEKGDCYIALTSDAAGEANRINVLSGSVCGGGVVDMTVARLLGLVDATTSGGANTQSDVTAYIQFRDDGSLVDRYDRFGDVYADDAWVICDGREFISASNEFKEAMLVAESGGAASGEPRELLPGVRFDINGVGRTTILVRHHLTQGAIFASLKLRDDVLLSQMDVFDDMMYRLATEFNAIHYAGYGGGDYADKTGMGFFEGITNKYGAFGKLAVEADIAFDESRLAASTGDGKGHSLGGGDGTNALSIARLKQMKLFHNGIASFDDLYAGFDAELGAFGQLAKTSMKTEDYVVEQLGLQRESGMGVNADEEMLRLVEMNQGYNYASQYVSTLIGVLNQIITGVGRVGL
jgi:flagellar hook-associated protein 1 FlgK